MQKILTKIIATVGPSSSDLGILKKLVKEGVSIFRINLSHGQKKHNEEAIKNIVSLKKLYKNIQIMLDTRGLELRVGDLKPDCLINKNQKLYIVDQAYYDKNYDGCKYLPINYSAVLKDIKIGQRVLIDEGKVECIVTRNLKNQKMIELKVVYPGLVTSKRHITFPGIEFKNLGLVPDDKADIKYFSAKYPIDIVSQSFIYGQGDVLEMRSFLKSIKKTGIKLFAKIETKKSLDNIVGILEASDGIMVARGDLATDIPYWEIPKWEIKLVKTAQKFNKFVIVATEMLHSMIHSPMPTRAEIIDVGFASMIGANAVMLSGETSIGKYPVETVRAMKNILVASENI